MRISSLLILLLCLNWNYAQGSEIFIFTGVHQNRIPSKGALSFTETYSFQGGLGYTKFIKRYWGIQTYLAVSNIKNKLQSNIYLPATINQNYINLGLLPVFNLNLLFGRKGSLKIQMGTGFEIGTHITDNSTNIFKTTSHQTRFLIQLGIGKYIKKCRQSINLVIKYNNSITPTFTIEQTSFYHQQIELNLLFSLRFRTKKSLSKSENKNTSW